MDKHDRYAFQKRCPVAGPAVTARRVGPPRGVGRPSLGDRVVVKAALDLQELAVVDALRGEMERSTFLGVILTEHISRPDLLPQPDQDQLPLVDNVLSTTTVQRLLQEIGEVPERPTPRRRPRRVQPLDATVRVHPDVREEFKRRSQRAGLALRQYNADVIRERLGIEPRAGRTEALPLAM
ncbi:hypothetical protein [Mycolicibacterium neoaurum]|uniref:hypothetical protein n=1 Tax=Mycolicibacterium neoaurum TaxID=1795 RepID=UPI001F4CD313|nr:hypothetical protein [Mycolicibacterium neoaurum]